ncbi:MULTISPECIES: hypothetical protein [unclassified Pseudoalteromonas]|uniref:hypothetical protein n=1 Tax=unclassified Pseudoalteromonas TaxID=194690 RepID=UPI002572211D|nr:hypothetical protein [Pseudoalteromonas sp. MM1]BED91133.1 hypothetical protein PspMM1_36010 [Pseudoalteromonas sp. MM1]
MSKEVSKLNLYFSSAVKASYEVAFISVPVLVWSVVIFSLGGSPEEVKKLAAWPFLALALFSTALKDGISAFHLDTKKDKQQREVVLTASIIGIVLSTVLLTLAILKSRQEVVGLFDTFYEYVFMLVFAGIATLFATKVILIQRVYYDHYV